MATLDLINLGIIERESQSKSSNLFIQPIPYTDSNKSFLLDLFGTQRDISISGIINASNKENLKTFISSIETIQNGRQKGSSYVGDLVSTSKNVFINRFVWNYNKADPLRIMYELELIEGAGIGA